VIKGRTPERATAKGLPHLYPVDADLVDGKGSPPIRSQSKNLKNKKLSEKKLFETSY